MELRHLRSFLEVAETLNFSRAAERLRIAQPALSKHIRELEEELGGKLLHRTTVKVSLTEMGQYFRQQTRRLIVQLDIAITGAQQLSKGAAGTLKVGCDWRANSLPIAAAARRFTEMNPQLSVQFVELASHAHLAAVRDHTIDVGFVPSIYLGDTEGLELRHIHTVRMKVVLPKGHRLAAKTSVHLRELKNDRWLALDLDSMPGFRVLMAQILQFTPRYGLTTTSLPGLIANVVAGHGVGLLPESVPLQEGVVAVDTDCMPMEVFAISAKEGGSPLVTSYLDMMGSLLKAAQKAPARSPAASAPRGR